MKEAINEWLADRKNRSLEDIARKNSIDSFQFKELVSKIYTQCVDAAINYQKHNENGLSHSGSAREKGVDFLIYVMFRKKYKIHDKKSEEGLVQAEGLKNNELYKREMPVSMELYKVQSPKKRLSETEKKIVNALYNFYKGVISGEEIGIFKYCRAEGVKEIDLVPHFMGENKLGMTKDKAQAYQYLKIIDEMLKE